MRIKGIISADRPCELCGNTNVERLVVIENDDGSLIRIGADCASQMMTGKRNRKAAKAIASKARAAQLATDLVEKHGTDSATLVRIRDAVFGRYGFPMDIIDGKVVVGCLDPRGGE